MIDVFIKSYKNDFWILKHALYSIKKNVAGYKNLILLIPNADKHEFDTRDLPPRTYVHYVDETGNGYMAQQVFKLNAFKYATADFIMFSDSDCIFTRKVDLTDYIATGKPMILYTDWNEVGDAICWKEPTARFLGWEPEWETMRRNCLIYHKSTLGNISIEYPNLAEQVLVSKTFSEFNFIGSYAYKRERARYNFVNTANWVYTPPIAEQIWSHADINGDKTHVYEWAKMLEVFMRLHEIEIPKRLPE